MWGCLQIGVCMTFDEMALLSISIFNCAEEACSVFFYMKIPDDFLITSIVLQVLEYVGQYCSCA